MARLDVREIMEREAKAQSRKDQWRSIYEDCYEFALPQRNMVCPRLKRRGVVWKPVAAFLKSNSHRLKLRSMRTRNGCLR